MTRHPVEKSRRQYKRWVVTETIEDYALRYLVICVLCWINTKVRSQRRWARLRSAIGKQELRILFQPQVNMISGQITGAEVLVRWQDPMPPLKFIPIAEESNLIIEIGGWVLRETCRQGRLWLDEGLPPLTLPISAKCHLRFGITGS